MTDHPDEFSPENFKTRKNTHVYVFAKDQMESVMDIVFSAELADFGKCLFIDDATSLVGKNGNDYAKLFT